MTALIVFGDLNWFEVQHGQICKGEEGDAICFLEDREYAEGENVEATREFRELTCPVFYHNGSRGYHESQRAMLNGAAGINIGLEHWFSHGDENSRELQRLAGTSNAAEISAFLGKWSEEMALQWEDELAAWATLLEFSHQSELNSQIAREIYALKNLLCSSNRWNARSEELSRVNGVALLKLLESGPAGME